jgi:class 3 adenylate cyclase
MWRPVFLAWQHLSGLGVCDQPAREQRRIRICNMSGVIGAVTSLGFAFSYAVAGLSTYWPCFVTAVLGATAMAAALPLNKAGHHDAACVTFLTSANLTILVVAMLFGPEVGFHFYFFVFAPVSFLLFSLAQRRIWLFSLLSLVSFMYIGYVRPPEDALFHLSAGAARAINGVSAFLTQATLIFILYLFHTDIARTERLLANEHERSEELLLNILPVAISQRLKGGQRSFADGFEEVTVLFADLVGFTELSARLTPEDLVHLLNRIFSTFDELSEEHGLEKIKTIGDCYMVASGLPVERPDHAIAVARMALAMRSALHALNRETGHPFDMRIGIHSGRVVAGVIGKRKFIYDLWGDTVNTASRMESHGLPGEIQVTAEVKRRIEGSFELASRGTIHVKGKGEMETFLLLGPKEAAA